MLVRSHLPHAIALRVCHFLNIATLLRLRGTCKTLLAVVTAELEQSLVELLALFVPHPQLLSEALVTNQAFVGGSVALAFILRDDSIRPSTLDIFVPRSQGMVMENHFAYYQSADESDSWFPDDTVNAANLRSRGLGQIVCTSANGRPIYLYESSENNALVPICRSWATHLVTYVNAAYFGTGYPALLHARRALLGQHYPGEEEQLDKYHRRGFDIRLYPSQWVDMQGYGCGASLWSCPTQTRRLNDKGSLTIHVQPLDKTAGLHDLIASVFWRMDTRPCAGACLRNTFMDAETTVAVISQ